MHHYACIMPRADEGGKAGYAQFGTAAQASSPSQVNSHVTNEISNICRPTSSVRWDSSYDSVASRGCYYEVIPIPGKVVPLPGNGRPMFK
jgi:hypothetical protein